VNPLFALDRAEAEGKIPKALAKRVRGRATYLVGAVKRVEKASELSYPQYYVEPVLPLAQSRGEAGQVGVLYARVIPTVATAGGLSILVQFTAALVAFGAKGTLEAVAGHEFTHYLDLVRRLSRMNVMSDERATSLFESSFADAERTVKMKSIFKDRSLIRLVERKFPLGLVDEKLNALVEKKWIEKNLPVRIVAPEENVVRLGMGSVLSSTFDPRVIARISSLEEKVRS
jgi:hypothetical protein